MCIICYHQCELLSSILSLLGIIIATTGFVMAVFEYFRNKRSKTVTYFAKQIIGFYSIEQEAIKWIHDLTKMNEQTIQRELRKRGEKNDNNLESVRPDMSASGARKYL